MVSSRSIATRAALVGTVVTGALLASVGVVAFGVLDDDPPEFVGTEAPFLVGTVVAEAHDLVTVEPVALASLPEGADAAVAGYALAAGTQRDAAWTIDLTSLGEAAGAVADRAAHGLLARGVDFERTGEAWAVLSGEGVLPEVRPDDDPAVVLAAVIEVVGSPAGLVAPFASAEVEGLARSLGLEPVSGADGLFLSRRDDRRVVAELAYVCHENVPLVGGEPCGAPSLEFDVVPVDTLDGWTVGVTGSLVPGAPQVPSSADGGVGWTNLEAQRYVADAVTTDGTGDTDDAAGLTLTAEARSDASIDELPFTSGLVVLDEVVGLSTIEVDVVLPAGDGLWPAVWLLDAEACEMPGRCPAYATDAYHEIDLLETNGARPDLAVTSLHWWDSQLRSASTSTEVPGLSDGSMHTIRLERRPGLLRWLVDGEEVYVIAGPVDAEAGPHRVAPMRLILNLAVGGRFAGDLQIGRNGRWWGDAWVPASFPDVGWESASLEVRGVRVAQD